MAVNVLFSIFAHALDNEKSYPWPNNNSKNLRGNDPAKGFNGTMELSFDVPTFADVDREYLQAITNGATSVLPPTTEPWGQRTCYVADPDGNMIEISSFIK